jgi:two-component system chemotaxis response regulator CheB
MTDPSVLLICHDPAHARNLASRLRSDRIVVLGITHNLMDAYTTAEETPPEFVLVEDQFVQLPEFEMLLALFKAMDIRWLAVGQSERTGGGPAVVSTSKSGLFPVNPDSDTALIAQKIREVTRAPQKAIARTQAQSTNPSQYAETVVLIGSSTGGVDALSTVLRQYPSNCPPTVIVQHTGKSFGSGLVRLLGRLCPAQVVAAEDGLVLKPGMVCVVAGIEKHVQVSARAQGASLQLVAGGPVSGHLPSIDMLFKSVPSSMKAVGVLLTGMGRDGAEGLLQMRNGGARTIGQDKESSVVYGMPRVAAELGAVEQQLPLDKIAPGILELCASHKTTRERAGV